MSRNTHRNAVQVSDLIEELSIGAAQRLRCDSDDIRAVVTAVVAYLRESYPAQDLYISAGPRTYPVADIKQAVADGLSMRMICKRFRVDRQTIYSLLQAS